MRVKNPLVTTASTTRKPKAASPSEVSFHYGISGPTSGHEMSVDSPDGSPKLVLLGSSGISVFKGNLGDSKSISKWIEARKEKRRKEEL